MRKIKDGFGWKFNQSNVSIREVISFSMWKSRSTLRYLESRLWLTENMLQSLLNIFAISAAVVFSVFHYLLVDVQLVLFCKVANNYCHAGYPWTYEIFCPRGKVFRHKFLGTCLAAWPFSGLLIHSHIFLTSNVIWLG